MSDNNYHLVIDIGTQKLILQSADRIIRDYPVSTARNGPGEVMDSECTPRGRHIIAEKIGAGCAANTIFVGRRPTGEIYTPALRRQYPGRDWILTRILWLQGTEPGVNRGGDLDSYSRYIYIHGAPDDVGMGRPGSRGCIRMTNGDVIELFEMVETGTPVLIKE